jgi:clan AA aspartic protease (TIGR02281 family)
LPLVVAAQDDSIDLFDNQDSMTASSISIEGTEDSGDFGLGGSSPGGPVRLKFARTDRSLLVETKINGRDAYMMFDTGATLTAIDSGFLRKVGLLPGPNAPETTISTANGMTVAKFGLIDNFQLGNRTHTGVTFLTCDACPSGMRNGRPIVGLLGLNVLNRYKYSIDESQGIIELIPTTAYNNRMRDIEPWARVLNGEGEPASNSRTRVKFSVQNLSKRTIEEMIFEVNCSTGENARLEPVRLPPKKTTQVTQLVPILDCGRASISTLGGRW